MTSSERDQAPPDPHDASDALPEASTSVRARHRLERVNESLEALGLSLPGSSTVLIWWKRVGLARLLSLAVLFGLPAGGYSTLLYSAARTIPDWIGDFGVRFEARETDIDLFRLQVAARDVTVRADARSEPVFTASEVVFDGSLATLFRGLFGPGAFYNEITVRQGELHLERSLSGSWNVEELVARVPPARRAAALTGLYRVNGLYIEDLKVVYTEHVPGNSGGGVIQTAQATVYVDDVNGWVLGLAPPEQAGTQPTRYQFKGRSADGIVELKGTAGLFDRGGEGEPGGVRNVSTAAASPMAAGLAGASFQMNIYLGNIGLAAYSQMVPTTRLLPTRGSLRGTVDMERSSSGFVCKANVAAENLEFAPNPRLVVVKAQFDRLQADLSGFRTSGPFDPCEGAVSDAVRPENSAGTMTAVLASFNAQTTRSAPPSVRAFAEVDEQQLGGAAADAALAEVMDNLAGRAGARVTRIAGARAGQVVRSLTASSASPAGEPAAASTPGAARGNPLTRGVRGIGGGIRRLFGGGGNRDEKQDAPEKAPATSPSGR